MPGVIYVYGKINYYYTFLAVRTLVVTLNDNKKIIMIILTKKTNIKNVFIDRIVKFIVNIYI